MARQGCFPPVFVVIYTLWHRVLDVAGFKEHPRSYALHVGAGSRLTGSRLRHPFVVVSLDSDLIL